ncbi:hypothetical protein VNO77_33499 [Canavalia gladiata]|uniref:Uncharacterized protein n=1 Tax=Canavalia gladiata TaxID=3824 RepID=A0AAN9KCJ2_CANGL
MECVEAQAGHHFAMISNKHKLSARSCTASLRKRNVQIVEPKERFGPSKAFLQYSIAQILIQERFEMHPLVPDKSSIQPLLQNLQISRFILFELQRLLHATDNQTATPSLYH